MPLEQHSIPLLTERPLSAAKEPADKIAELWHAWSDAGVTASSELAVDHFFYSKAEERARALATHLAGVGMVVEVSPQRTLLFFKGWTVQATHRSSGWSLARLREREAEMEELAGRFDMLYDGCGAEMP